MAEKLFVQPATHESRSGNLTRKGFHEIELLERDLRAREIGERVIILTSNSVPAEQTTMLLRDGLIHGGHTIEALSSAWLRLAGEEPRAVKVLDGFLGGMMTMANCTVEEEDTLVVVTHAPLIRAALGLPDNGEELPLGSVVGLAAWENPNFDAVIAARTFGVYVAPEFRC